MNGRFILTVSTFPYISMSVPNLIQLPRLFLIFLCHCWLLPLSLQLSVFGDEAVAGDPGGGRMFVPLRHGNALQDFLHRSGSHTQSYAGTWKIRVLPRRIQYRDGTVAVSEISTFKYCLFDHESHICSD